MMPLGSNTARLAIAAAAIVAFSACSRSCDSTSAGSADSGATPSGLRPTAAHARTPRLDGIKTTREMLTELAADCLPCAEKNGCLDPAQQGATCEGIAGVSKANGQTETALCLDILRCIFTSKCANNNEESQCVCGTTDLVSCMEGTQPPTGSCITEYQRDYGADANGKLMSKEFLNHDYGAGGANAIIQCVMPLCPSCRIP